MSPGNPTRTEQILAEARKAVQKGITAEERQRLEELIKAERKRLDGGLLRRTFNSRSPGQQRAYNALEALDLACLERLCPEGMKGSRPARIPGLLSSCDTLHETMQEAASVDPGLAVRMGAKSVYAYQHVREIAGDISKTLDGVSVESFSFSQQTYRAVQWVLFLQNPQIFEQHLDVLHRTAVFFREYLESETRLSKFRKSGFHLRYYPGSALFRMTSRRGGLDLTINEGFLRAPDSVLQAVVRSAFRSTGKSEKQTMGAYSTSQDYLEISRRLLNQPEPGCPEQGLFHNLADIYQSSVRDFLPRSTAIPLMRWMERTSYRTYGVYQSSSDTIRISPALDYPDVPEYVLGYVLFHELAHARVGVRVRGGRHQIHSKRFYAVEKEYPMRIQAASFLRSLSQKIA